MRTDKISAKKEAALFVTRFLLCFTALYLLFPLYRGLTGQGGSVYSEFLDTQLNLIKGFSYFLTSSAKLILEEFHYAVMQNDYHTLRIEHSRGVIVNPSCLGWGVMSFWIAFVFANAGTWEHKLWWMLRGLTAIILLNITRIVLITLANHQDWQFITSLDHHQTFNILSYSCIFLLMVWYIRMQKKYEGVYFSRQRQQHALSPV